MLSWPDPMHNSIFKFNTDDINKMKNRGWFVFPFPGFHIESTDLHYIKISNSVYAKAKPTVIPILFLQPTLSFLTYMAF